MRRFLPPLLALLCTVQAASATAGEPVIRVAISRGASSLNLKTSARLYVVEVDGGQKFMLLENSSYEVRPQGSGIAIAGQHLSSPIRLLPGEGQEKVRLGKHLYQGDIYINLTEDRKLDIVEHLGLEEYLYGVLPVEMSPDWPMEALKAQAVASRTYALKHISPNRDYDVSNGTEKQAYNGTHNISPRIKEAVDSTKGLVLKYKGKLITAFFHACCGGHTASAKAAWGEDLVKPLYGVADPYCKPSSHYRWRLFVPAQDLLKAVQSLGSTALKIKSVKVGNTDRTGRALTIRVRSDSGSGSVPASDLRNVLGTFEFRSTYITSISAVKGGYEFAGRGWGHGVGMCQDGAKYMALKGRPFKRILRQYYPGAAITDI